MNLPISKENILFLDIETVPQNEHFTDLSEAIQQLYADKTAYQRKEEKTPDEQFAASKELQGEFGDIETFKAYLDANEGGQVNVFTGGSK